ncbi:MAG: glycosyltransferase family A protein, partial [Bryobacteraceae bacterium]
STALTAAAKPYATEAGRRALAASLLRRGAQAARIQDGPIAHSYRIERQSHSRVSFIICSRNPNLLRRCLESLRSTVSDFECVVVHHRQGADGEMARLLESFACNVVPFRGV